MMFTHISKMYYVLYKYLGQKLVPSGEEQAFLAELESGWTFDPSRIKLKLAEGESHIQQLHTLTAEGITRSNTTALRNKLLELQYVFTSLSCDLSSIADDIEQVLEKTQSHLFEVQDSLTIDSVDYQHEILSNDANFPDFFSESSFVSIFHEDAIWDFNAYWRFDLALFALAKNENMLSAPHLYQSVFRTYSYLIKSIGCSLDENDGFTLELDYESLCELRTRLEYVVVSLFEARMPDNHTSAFHNPYL